MKKVLTSFLVLSILVLSTALLSGCGGQSGQTQQQQNAAKSGNEQGKGQGPVSSTSLSEEDILAAEESFDKLMTAIRNLDMESTEEYLVMGSLADDAERIKEIEGGDLLLEAVFSSVEYEKVASIDNKDGTLTIMADITTIDLFGVLGECTMKVLGNPENIHLTDEERDAVVEETFKNEIKKEGLPTQTKQVSVKMRKDQGAWKAEMNEAFLNSISGEFIGSMNKAQQDMTNNQA